MPFGHHLIWFNPAVLTPELLPDGTDASQSPGGLWVRRMWAGGSIQLKPDDYFDQSRGCTMDTVMAGTEHIKHVRLHGEGDTAKVFVTIERRFARLDSVQSAYRAKHGSLGRYGGTQKVRNYLEQQARNVDGWGDAILKEERNLVFFKERTAAELEAVKAGQMATVKYLDRAYSRRPLSSLLTLYSPQKPRLLACPHSKPRPPFPLFRSYLQRSSHSPRSRLRSQRRRPP
jgi:hydroxyacyl-ACP dehydratase HTD2-like protein with hotdog domain